MPKVYDYSEEIAQEICDAVSTSTLGIRGLCKQNKHWPNYQTIRRWRNNPSLSFGIMYAQAKQQQIDGMVERIFEITKDKTLGYLIDSEGKKSPDHTYIAKMRCEIDAIKWLAAKLAPKIYGESKEKDSGQDAISQFKVENE